MSVWRQLVRGVRVLTNRSAADQQLTDEVQHYLESATAANVERGMSPNEALRAARLELGGATQVKEQVRDYGWENAAESALSDLRYALRGLRQSPGFTAITILTLAVGTGATTAIFSAVNPILFESLPYPDADRIAMIWETTPEGAQSDGSFGMYLGLVERSRSFDAMAAFKPWQPTLSGDADQPERLNGQRVSASYFRVLGVPPLFGRAFEPAEDRLNGANVIILSDRFWRRRFAADPTIIGTQIALDEQPFVVAGVMPSEFENVLDPNAELWAPLQYDISQGRAWGHHLRIVARLRPDVSVDQATRELTTLGNRVLVEQRPTTYGPSIALVAVPLQDDVTRSVKGALIAILVAAALVLAIACVNVTNLLLARGVRRRGEFALRTALGAGQKRLVRQLLTESLVVAALGGLAGLALAMVGVRVLVALSPAGLPRVDAIAVKGTAYAFSVAISTLVGLTIGLAPALQAMRGDPQHELQRASRRTAGGQRRARSLLVVTEVAIAIVLLVSSGLLLRSSQRLFSVEQGFDASNILTMQVQTSGQRFNNDTTTYRFFDQVLETVRQLPGVSAAGLTSQLPLSGDQDLYGVAFESRDANNQSESRGTFRYAVSPGYLESMRIPLKRGRLLTQQDDARAPRVVVISESLARRRLPGVDPLGKRLSIGPPERLYTVVGVVGDVKQMSLAVDEADAVYTTPAQWQFADNVMTVVARSENNVSALGPAIRRAIWSVDKNQPIVRSAMMRDLVAASAAERRFVLTLFAAFALAALLLAAAGIYGILSGSVAERTREFGARAALGATRSDILGLVLRQGLSVTAVGVAIGLVLAGLATTSLSAMLFGISRLDGTTYIGVVALLTAVAMIACALPAWRAMRVDPATVLRVD